MLALRDLQRRGKRWFIKKGALLAFVLLEEALNLGFIVGQVVWAHFDLHFMDTQARLVAITRKNGLEFRVVPIERFWRVTPTRFAWNGWQKMR